MNPAFKEIVLKHIVPVMEQYPLVFQELVICDHSIELTQVVDADPKQDAIVWKGKKFLHKLANDIWADAKEQGIDVWFVVQPRRARGLAFFWVFENGNPFNKDSLPGSIY